jgi:protein-L-isoaspartate(D-aspartate) O-methyltransferase
VTVARGNRSPRFACAAVALLSFAACAEHAAPTAEPEMVPAETGDENEWARQRAALAAHLAARGVLDRGVLAAIGRVPRHHYVPAAVRAEAYEDHPLPIGEGQTISQPYVVAAMTAALRLGPEANVLEVGTGSGYQAAVIAEMIGLGPGAGPAAPHGRLVSIEIVPALAERSARLLESLGYREVLVVAGDGYRGFPERAPFDAIIVTAAPGHVPEPLKEQLRAGGRLVIPVGEANQELLVITRTADGFEEEQLFGVRFVPMTGEAERR